VNVSSTGAKVAIPLLGAYSSSKSGLEGMSDAPLRELMLFGVDVVIIEVSRRGLAAPTQKWTAGWDNFHEPLNYKTSNVSCSRV
jgi:NAD(P)-dependent dehydrogenase (short-subunit alcohol dehydrogenase family)